MHDAEVFFIAVVLAVRAPLVVAASCRQEVVRELVRELVTRFGRVKATSVDTVAVKFSVRYIIGSAVGLVVGVCVAILVDACVGVSEG